jgi:endonuclease YncB( thermonuclease family)
LVRDPRTPRVSKALAGLVLERAMVLLGLVCMAAMLLGCAHSRAQTWRATVSHVQDGDTLYVRAAGQAQAVPVRIRGIDAPELCQAGGPESRQALHAQLHQQEVSLLGQGHDSYGRIVAQVLWNGQDMGRWLVAQGHAWSYRRGKEAGPYALEEREARKARRGLFAQGRPELPAAFRHRHGSCKSG